MATVTLDAAGPGVAAKRPLFAQSPRPMKVITGVFSFDNSYPTGGEDVTTTIFDHFTELLGIDIADPTASAGTGKKTVVDYTNKKLMLYTNAATPAEVANASDQSGAASLRF